VEGPKRGFYKWLWIRDLLECYLEEDREALGRGDDGSMQLRKGVEAENRENQRLKSRWSLQRP
jgi:hypothetical protein